MSLHPEILALIEAGPQQVAIGKDGIGVESYAMFARRTAALAVEKEREECAKVCMRRIDVRWAEHSIVEPDTNAAYYPKSVAWMETADEEAEDCAAAIRRRRKP